MRDTDVDDEEALHLNTLHRFRKFSPRLLYSHCEVPAGCGGVVLRWIDPSAATSAVIRVFAEAQLSTRKTNFVRVWRVTVRPLARATIEDAVSTRGGELAVH